jgi:transcription elongation factor SPT6
MVDTDTEDTKLKLSSLIDDAAALSDDNENENENDDLDNSQQPVDSSEEDEDEDEDEDEIRKVREGFIVDDEEEEDDETEESTKKNRRKRHRDHTSNVKIDDELDEDDLALLRENANHLPSSLAEKSKFKRLKRGGDDIGDEDSNNGLTNIFSDEEEDNDKIRSRAFRKASFTANDNEDLEENEQDDDDLNDALKQKQQKLLDQVGEFDDFIEDDEFSEEDEDRDEKLARMRSARAKQSQFAQQSKIDQDKLDELYEIFGDGEEYAWALEAEDVEDEDEDNMKANDNDDENELEYDDDGNIISKSKSSDTQTLKNIFEYEELKEHLLTDRDQLIRTTDIPERYQVLREGISNYDLNDIDFKEKQKWVAESLFTEKANFFNDETKKHLIEPFKSSVAKIVEFISRENLEVPTIWNSRKDYTLYTSRSSDDQIVVEKLLNENDLWRIVRLDIDYHALYEKQKTIEKLFQSLDTVDLVYDECIASATTITDLQDLYDYLQFTYSLELKKIQENLEVGEEKKKKIHSRFKVFERVKSDPIYNIIKEIGIDAEKIGENIMSNSKIFLTDDNSKSPIQLISEYLPESYFSTTESALHAVKQMYSQQLVHNPKIRSYLRSTFEKYSNIDIELTEKGRTKINESSPYADFKYAINRNPESFFFNPDLFLRMLEAESLGYVIIKIGMKTSLASFIDHLFTFMSSDGASEISSSWNKLRREGLDLAINKLIPNIIMSVKEKIKNTCENLLYFQIRDSFINKVDQAPYIPFSNKKGMVSRVLALTNGEGKKDSAVIAIAMDFDGTISHHVKFDESIRDNEFERKLLNLIDRFKPEVVAVSGYNINCSHLKKKVEEIVKNNKKTTVEEDEDEYNNNDHDQDKKEVELPVIYVPNETARLFEYSERANEEFSDKPVVAKFCIGIARYVQNPLLEYISLSDSITSIQIHKHQSLLPEHKLREAIDSIFVDIQCLVGIKINDAIRSNHYAQALPYIAGLGPRKSNNLIKGIEANGGALIRRDDLILKKFVTKNVFMNCAPFIEIPVPDRYDKDIELLDATRIHPEDYDLARKMASDALDLEEEDRAEVESDHGGIIGKLYDDGVEKLDDLLLEGYANQLEEHGHRKRATLEMIKEELQNNYEELRKSFHILTEVEVFEMLTNETKETFDRGVIVPVIVQKVDNRYLLCITQNGIFGNIARASAVPYGDSSNLLLKFQNGQAVQAVVKSVEYGEFKAEFSLLKEDIARAKSIKKGDRYKGLWNFDAENKDIKRERDAELRENKGNKRILKHPYFRNFDSRQAEDYLASRDNGEFVIRPSNKGNDHLTITWKIDNQLFQHIDVTEHDKPNEYSLGRVLQVGEFKYHDLDELIVSHINELHSKVESMKNHEKFRNEPVNDARDWIVRYSKANNNRSCYCFCFNRKAPGWFFLLFKLNDSSEKTYKWNVKVLPNGYLLYKNSYPDMVHLCNGFKKLLQNQMMNHGTTSSNVSSNLQSAYSHTSHSYSQMPQSGTYRGGYANNYGGGYDSYGGGYDGNRY